MSSATMSEAQYRALAELERSVDRFVYLNQSTGHALVRRGWATDKYVPRPTRFDFRITGKGVRALADERAARSVA